VLRTALTVAFFTSLPALAQVTCEAPRIRETTSLATAVSQDKAMAATFLKTSNACQMAESDACDAARLECGTQLATTLKAQVGFDDGAWLRDMLLPYAGLTYPATRAFQAGASAIDTACTGDATLLMSASSRRTLQAARRQALLDEYPRYALWANDQAKACRDRSAVDATRKAQERSEAERLAAVALAATTAEAMRQKAEQDAADRAEAAARAKADAERLQKEAAEKAARERMTVEERAKADKAEALERAKAEKAEVERKAADERQRLEEKQAKERAAAEEKAREVAAQNQVTSREQRKLALRAQKDKLTAQAAEAEKRAAEIAAMTFTVEQSQQAAALQQERVQATARAKTLRAQADELVIHDEDERSRGALGILGGGGAATWPGTTAGALGGEAVLHLGFWGTAPAEGLASGFEVRALGRYLTTLGPNNVQQAEGLVSGRYFFGRFGVGLAAELRWNRIAAISEGNFQTLYVGFGPSLGLAFVDSPKTRVVLNATWLPLTDEGFQNPVRATGNLEISYEFLTFNVSGGTQTQYIPFGPTPVTPVVAWYFGAFGGVRVRW